MPTKSQQTKILWQSHTLQVLAEVATKLQDLKACWQSLASLGSGQSQARKTIPARLWLNTLPNVKL